MALKQAVRKREVQSLFRDAHDSSSFGPIGVISEVSAGRLKGFVGGDAGKSGKITPVETAAHASFLAEVVGEGIDRIERSENLSRLTIRSIVGNSSIERLKYELEDFGAQIEAAIPVNESHMLVYIGYNSAERTQSLAQHRADSAAIENAVRAYGIESDSLAQLARNMNANSRSYTMEVFNWPQRRFPLSDMHDMTSLLSTFGYSEIEARKVLFNHHNLIGVVHDSSHRPVGISVVEKREIELSSGPVIRLAEVTTGTVAPDSNGKELYSGLLSRVFNDIAQNSGDINLIYAETNVAKEALLKASVIQGRTFNGILPNHAFIRNRTTGQLELKSLAVTSLTRSQLTEFLGRLDTQVALQQAIRD